MLGTLLIISVIQGVTKNVHQTSQGHRRDENNGGYTNKKKSISASLPSYGPLKSKNLNTFFLINQKLLNRIVQNFAH